MDIDEDDLTRRAFAAYFRSGDMDQPAGTSGVTEHDGKVYVELHNVNGTLAVYRVRPSGALKRLRRWPAQAGGGGMTGEQAPAPGRSAGRRSSSPGRPTGGSAKVTAIRESWQRALREQAAAETDAEVRDNQWKALRDRTKDDLLSAVARAKARAEDGPDHPLSDPAE